MSEEITPTNWDDNQPDYRQWVFVIGIGIVFLCGLAAFIFFGFQTFNRWTVAQNENATQVAATSTAEVATRVRAIQEASRWPTLTFDPFTENVNEWMDGEIDDEYATMSLSVNGRYVWNASAKQGFIWRVWPRSDVVSDFYLAVDAQNLSDNLDAQYGLIFRNNDGAYYYLEVRDTQYFEVYSYINNEWNELITSTYTEAIRPGAVNRLEIAAKDDVFYFLINNQFVGETIGSLPSRGQVGVAIGMSNAGEEATIAFDNFELRALETFEE
jgi:hypothetical protein